MDIPAELSWQCRRGSKELDLLLRRYLEQSLPFADDAEKCQFEELLKMDDSELFKQLLLLLKVR